MDEEALPPLELSIRINRELSTLRLEVDEDLGEDFCLPGPGELRARRLGLRDKLESIRRKLTFDSLDQALSQQGALQRAMNDLRDVGKSLGNALFGGADEMNAARVFLNEAVPRWRMQDGSSVILTVYGPSDAMLPFEVIPLFEYAEYWEVTNAAELFDAARRMLGFSTTMQRVLTTRRVPQSGAQPSPRLSCRFVQDAALSNSAAEIAYLTRQDRARVEGPWPTHAYSADEVTSVLGRSLIDPAIDFEGRLADPAHIVQFSCHCDTSREAPLDYAIGMGPREGRVWVSLGALESRFTELVPDIPADRQTVRRPMVFLNACGGASVDPITATSFPDFFIKEKFSAFVGPLVDVPDEVASKLGSLFYGGLLAGASIGGSLRDARWGLLSRYGSCLGVFWSAYCAPDQRLVVPV